MTMQENADTSWVRVVFWVLQFDLREPFVRQEFAVQMSALIAGWGVVCGLLLILVIRAPFRIRHEATSMRKIRDLEKEILELRTLPLRQKEEDELLAAEAHIETRPKKILMVQPTTLFVKDEQQ